MINAVAKRYQDAYRGLSRDVWVLALVWFVNRCGTMVLPFLTLYLTKIHKMEQASAARMISVYGSGAICGSYFGGWATTRWGAIRVQTSCLLLSVPCFLVLPYLNGWLAISTGLFVLAFFSEAVRPANNAAITQLAAPENRTRAFALQRLAANLGFSFGPAIGGLLAAVSFHWLFVVDALTTLAGALVLLAYFRWRADHSIDLEKQKVRDPRPIWADYGFVAFLGLMLATSIVFFQFASTYPLYLSDHYQLSERGIGLIFAVNTLVIVAFEMVLVDACKRWSLLRVLTWGCFFSCLGFGILPFGDSFAYCIFSMLIITLGEMLSLPLAAGFVAGRSPEGREGAYMGWYSVVLAMAWVVGPFAGAFLYGIHRDGVWYAGLGIAILVLVGFRILERRLARPSPHSADPAQDADDGRSRLPADNVEELGV